MDIVAINRRYSQAITDDDQVLIITNWIDVYGDECSDRTLAVSCIAKVDDHHWVTIDLTQFQTVGIQ